MAWRDKVGRHPLGWGGSNFLGPSVHQQQPQDIMSVLKATVPRKWSFLYSLAHAFSPHGFILSFIKELLTVTSDH